MLRPRPWMLALAGGLCAGCLNLGTRAERDAAPAGAQDVAGPSGAAPSDGAAAAAPGSTAPDHGGSGTPGTIVPGAGILPGTSPEAPGAGTSVAGGAEPRGLSRYTLVGRFDVSNPDAVRMSFLGSKIGIGFTGTSLAVRLADTGTDGFNVTIDNGAPQVFYTAPSASTVYPLAQNLAPGLHTAWLTKRTEFSQQRGNVFVGTTTLYGFVLDANARFATPPAARARRIEAVGDSSFSAYGAESGTPSCEYSPQTQNADVAVGAQVATALGAEAINLSFTGQGIVFSAYDRDNKSHLLPVIYNEAVAPAASPAYGFATPVDVVLISAGGNDLDGPSGSGFFPDTNAFINGYAAWLRTIRGRNPRALIVPILSPAATGTDRPALVSAIDQAISLAQGPGGDPNIVFFDYFEGDPAGWRTYDDAARALNLGYGCQYHPSVAGSRFLAGRLAAMVKTHMGW